MVERSNQEAPHCITAVTWCRPQIEPQEVHPPSAIRSFSWPWGEQSWRIYQPQEDRGCTYLALSTGSEGCQKLSGSLLLQQMLCLWLCWHCQTPLQANWGPKRIPVDQRVWGCVSLAKNLADNSSHFGLPNCRLPAHLRYRCKQHWPWRSTLSSPRGGGGREGDCIPQQVTEQEREKLFRDP